MVRKRYEIHRRFIAWWFGPNTWRRGDVMNGMEEPGSMITVTDPPPEEICLPPTLGGFSD